MHGWVKNFDLGAGAHLRYIEILKINCWKGYLGVGRGRGSHDP